VDEENVQVMQESNEWIFQAVEEVIPVHSSISNTFASQSKTHDFFRFLYLPSKWLNMVWM
jgi:hypothetical protein